ncbi:MAG: alpha-2-macroglobulin family protein [Prevotella sp.]
MRLLSLFALFFSLSVGASDFGTLWKRFEKYQNDDMPRQSIRVLDDISQLASRHHAYGDLLGAEFSRIRVMASISVDSVSPALVSLHLKASQMWAERGDDRQKAVTAAICLTVFSKWQQSMSAIEAGRLGERVTSNARGKGVAMPPQADSCVMSVAPLLASTPYAPYKRIIDEGRDDRLFASDMLSVLGHELGMYSFLETFYKQNGNRAAACVEACHRAVMGGADDGDNLISQRRGMLRDAMREYADVPESSFLAEAYFDLMLSDDDISEATRHAYLLDAKERYTTLCRQHRATRYTSWIDNSLAAITMPQLSAEISDRLILNDIRNVSDVTVTLQRVNADGRADFNVHSSDGLREVERLLLPDAPVTLSRRYSTPSWQTHADTIPMPDVPYGVYLVTVKGGALVSHAMYYHSDLALLFLPLSSGRLRLVSVSSSSGHPVPHATVVFMKRKQRRGGYDELLRVMTGTAGEAVVDSVPDADMYYVMTATDKAFSKSRYRPYFSSYTHRQTRDLLTAFASRAIYRPGQTVEGVAVAYNATDETDIHTVGGKAVCVTLYDADNTVLSADTVLTDSCGNAPFSILIPMTAKAGRAMLSFTSAASEPHTLPFSIEEYRRPTFRVDVAGAERFSEMIYIPRRQPSAAEPPTARDTVRFRAMTYSDTPVRDAKVRYTIVRRPLWRIFWPGKDREKVIARDAVSMTDGDGIVSIPLLLSLPEDSRQPYVFTVSVSITDSKGETQRSSQSLRCCHEMRDAGGPAPLPVRQSPTECPDYELSSYTFPRHGDVTLSLRRCPPSVSSPAAYVYYTLYADGHPIEHSSFRLDTLCQRRFSYRPEYGGGLTVSCVWIERRASHAFSATIQKPRPDLSLRPSWTVFRDYTSPGSEESWTLSLPASDSLSLPASLSATLYDKSLDAIVPHSWAFAPSLSSHNVYARWLTMYNARAYAALSGGMKDVPQPYRLSLASLNRLVSPGYARYASANSLMMRKSSMPARGAMASKRVSPDMVAIGAMSPMLETADMSSSDDTAFSTGNDMGAGQALPAEDISRLLRTSLGETAFFFPSIKAGGDRAFHIHFRMPETMTSWRFIGFVHDSSMRHAVIDTTVVTRKDLITRPNVPRFVRVSDRPVLSVSVDNLTPRAQDVETIVRLSRSVSSAPFWQQAVRHAVRPDSSSAVSFHLPEVMPEDTLLVVSVVSRTAEGFSDGERHMVTVVPDVETVRRTIALTLHGDSRHDCPLSAIMSPSGLDATLAVECTADAAMLVRSAIPSVSSPQSPDGSPVSPSPGAAAASDAISLATSLYIGRLLSVADTVLSGRRLSALQLPDGSWPWWQGMQPSPYTTVSIARLLARLHHHGRQTELSDSMLHKAVPRLLSYLMDETARMREYKRRHPKAELRPSETLLDILYTVSLSRCRLSPRERREAGYVIDLLRRPSPSMSLYAKAVTSVILSMNGHSPQARRHLASLMEHSVSTPEAGRWFETPRAPYSWRAYRIPTVVAAIEAVAAVMPDSLALIDDMRRWLLHERRSQQWDTSLDTADAIYAFLTAGTREEGQPGSSSPLSLSVVYTDSSREATLVEYDSRKPAPASSTATPPSAGTEWRRPGTLLTATLPRPHADGHVVIERHGESTSWIAASVTQTVPLRLFRPEGDGSGLHIRREILTPDGQPLAPSALSALAVGARVVVRITVVSGRDCDFVVVRDSRPAALSPVVQASGYHHAQTSGTASGACSGYYRATGDTQTTYWFDRLPKGTHVIETEYTIDRRGHYASGTATVSCAYAPEFSAVAGQYSM